MNTHIDNTHPTWAQWLCTPQREPLFFILNSLAQPNPLTCFYQQDWVEQAFALYQDTPLQPMVLQGPWLIQPKITALPAIAAALQKRAFSDQSWGWAYRSALPWQQQIAHWQQRHLVQLDEQAVVLRLMDTRIIACLLPALTPDDWCELLNPVSELMLDLPQSETTPANRQYWPPAPHGPANYAQPFTLGPHLIHSWESSAKARNNHAFALCCQLWEQQGQTALTLDTPKGAFADTMLAWVNGKADAGWRLNALNPALFLDELATSALITPAKGI